MIFFQVENISNFFFFISVSYFIAYIYHNLFAYSSIDEYFGFQYLTPMTKLLAIFLYKSFSVQNHSLLLEIYSGVELLGHRHTCVWL